MSKKIKTAESYMEMNRRHADEYKQARLTAVDNLCDFFIDKRGCSRLIAAGYALEAVRERYEEISAMLSKCGLS